VGIEDFGAANDGGPPDATAPDDSGLDGPSQSETGRDGAPPVATALALGEAHSCALMSDHTVECWGSNTFGEMGTAASDAAVLTPMLVPGLDHVAAIFSGADANHTLALLDDGGLICWGKNDLNECNNTSVPTSPPTPVAGLGAVTRAAAGFVHSCAAFADAGISCWGDWSNATSLYVVAHVGNAPQSATSLSASYSTSCATGNDGTVGCWGDGNYGTALGDFDGGSTLSALTPFPIGAVAQVSVAGGSSVACAVLVDGGVTCWGTNADGETTNPDLSSGDPANVPGLGTVVEVAMGETNACARDQGGGVTCWGSDNQGESGQPSGGTGLSPTSVGLGALAVAIAAGSSHVCAILEGGTVKCWGANESGQLGDGTGEASNPIPQVVTF